MTMANLIHVLRALTLGCVYGSWVLMIALTAQHNRVQEGVEKRKIPSNLLCTDSNAWYFKDNVHCISRFSSVRDIGWMQSYGW